MRTFYSRIITRLIDKHRITGHWAWLKHRHKEMQWPTNVLDNDGQGTTIYHDSKKLPDDIYNFPHDGILFIYSFGDSHQLPPVMKKPANSDESAKLGTADMLGCIAFSEFLNLDNESECQSTIDFKDEVICQNDPCFLSILSNMRNGTVTAEQDSALLLRRCLNKLPSNKRTGFDNALWLVPTWKEANQHIFHYLQSIMTSPIAKINAQLHTSRSDGKKCCIRHIHSRMHCVLAQKLCF